MTPTEQDIAFFASEEAKGIQEFRPESLIDEWVGAGDVWIPRPQQLWEMLEERGYDWLLEVGALRDKEERYEAVLYGLCTKSTTAVEVRVYAPTPSIALGKCLLGVLKEE